MTPAAALVRETAARPVRLRMSWPAAVGTASLLLYVSFPAARYNFDGVACAISVDLGSIRHLVHGNHVSYAVLGAGVHGLLGLLGYEGPAIVSLQLFSSLLGAVGVAGLCALLLNLGLAPAVAAAASAGLALSRAWWVWSLESQVYPLGAACLVWVAAELVRAKPRPVLAALLHCGAILGHAPHLIFAPVAWAMLPDARARRSYFFTLAVGVAASYAAAILFFFRPTSFADLRVWLLGSAALPADRHFYWQGFYSFGNVWLWIRTTLETPSGDAWVGAAIWGIALWGVFEAARHRPRAARLGALWLVPYAALYSNWQPYIVQYHYSDMPVLWLFIACAVDGAGRGDLRIPVTARAGALAAAAVFLGVWNWAGEIRPMSDPASNADLQRSLWIGRETPDNAWVVVEAIEQVYLPYFAHRRPMNLRYLPDAQALKARVLSVRRSGEPVYVVPQILPAWAGRALQELGWREVAAHRDARLYLIH